MMLLRFSKQQPYDFHRKQINLFLHDIILSLIDYFIVAYIVILQIIALIESNSTIVGVFLGTTRQNALTFECMRWICDCLKKLLLRKKRRKLNQ